MKRIIITLAAAAICTAALAQLPGEDSIVVPDYSAYILTPPAPDTPRINGPRIYGARPRADFLYRIPATGVRPMTFSAKGLPRGLKLDPATGIIRGKARRKGSYDDGDYKSCRYSVTCNLEDVGSDFHPSAVSLRHDDKGELGFYQVQRVEYYHLTNTVELWV